MTIRKLESVAAAISRVGKRRQVVIPRQLCEELGLQEGDFVELWSAQGTVVIKPKKLVDPEDILTPLEGRVVRKGEAELRRGNYVTLAHLQDAVDSPAVKKRRKTA